ncbi:MAG: prolipoprotein diacylglyceryl transferase [Clostridium sp.]|jgi:prolipoprotein diacylglyceryltransferase|nr:prolipoprotein diacylglyceryl transferase [Clostridium sp.]
MNLFDLLFNNFPQWLAEKLSTDDNEITTAAVRDMLYWGSSGVGLIVATILVICTLKWMNIRIRQAPLITITIVPAGFFSALFTAWIFDGWGGRNEIIGSFLLIPGAFLFLPALMWPLLKLARLPQKEFYDLSAAPIAIMVCFGKLGCCFGGCCFGELASWGVTPAVLTEGATSVYYLPIPEFESFAALFACIFTLWFIKKSKSYIIGSAWPICAGIFSTLRFISDFFRYYSATDPVGHTLGLTLWQWFSLLTVIYCVAWLWVLYNKAFEARGERSLNQRLLAAAESVGQKLKRAWNGAPKQIHGKKKKRKKR